METIVIVGFIVFCFILCTYPLWKVRKVESPSATAKILEVMSTKYYPSTVTTSYYKKEVNKGVKVKGVSNNFDTPYGPLAKDIFIPIPNTFFVDSNRKEHQLYEHFLPYHLKNFHVDDKTKNLYGTLTLAYVSALVANHMTSLKPPMVKFEDENQNGLSTPRMELEVGRYSRTHQGYYDRVNTREKLYIKKLIKSASYPILEDLIGPHDRDAVYSLPQPLDDMIRHMTKGKGYVDKSNGLLKGIPMKNLHSLDPSTDVRMTNLRNRYFFNSDKEFKIEWLTEEIDKAIDSENIEHFGTWSSDTYEVFFRTLYAKLSPFGKMYLYNFFYYYILNDIVNRIVAYCNAKGKLGVDKEIFSELFTFRNGRAMDLTHAVKISPDYITGVMMENQYVNSGVMKLYHMNQDENKHALSLVSVNWNEGELFKPYSNMPLDSYVPVLTFNAYKVKTFMNNRKKYK